MTGRRRAVGVHVVAAVLVASTGACGVVGGDEGGYAVTVYFDSAIGVYPSGDVLVMGLPVGTVDDIDVEDTRVRVDLTIDGDVPLPADVNASIEAETVLGERNVSLFPAWSAALDAAGARQLADGAVIPRERTTVPVEPDEALQAFTDLAAQLDADKVGDLLADSATILDGRGATIGRGIDAAAGLTDTLADIDQPLLDAATALNSVASVLNGRDAQLRSLIDSFAGAVAVLASEREDIRRLLAGMVALTDEANAVLDVHGDRLPGTIATLATTIGVIDANAASIETIIDVLPQVAESFEKAYREDLGGFFLKVDTLAVLDTVVRQLIDALGLYPGEI